jgi:iron-sulfur cluster repair protein YtfE (RIC family)
VRPILVYMANDHQRCDALFAHVEACIERREWTQADLSLLSFSEALASHLTREETVLFPAFEQATGSHVGPTGMLRLEHKYIRAIVSRVIEAVERRDANDFFGHASILRIMLQQHNVKEETILYVMIDRILADQREQIITGMEAVNSAEALNVFNLDE